MSATRGGGGGGGGGGVAGWVLLRNLLVLLIAIQMIVLIAIGFSISAPSSLLMDDTTTSSFLFFHNSQQPQQQPTSLISTTKKKKKTHHHQLDFSHPSSNNDWLEEEEEVNDKDITTHDGAFTVNFRRKRSTSSSFRNNNDLDQIKAARMMTTIGTPIQNLTLLLQNKKTITTTTTTTTSSIIHPCRHYEIHNGTLRVLTPKVCHRVVEEVSSSNNDDDNNNNNKSFIKTTTTRISSILAYNSMSFDRLWCNKTIPPLSLERFDMHCLDEPRLSSSSLWNETVPPILSRQMPPITLIREGSLVYPRRIPCPPHPHTTTCYATVENLHCTLSSSNETTCSSWPPISTWHVQGTDMTFTYSMLAPSSSSSSSHNSSSSSNDDDSDRLTVDRKAHRNYNYLATRSFQSDIPLSYFSSFDLTRGRKTSTPPAVQYDMTKKAISFFKSDGCNKNGSIRRAGAWAKAISQHIQLDSYGTCFPTTDLPKGMSLQNTTDREILMKQHLFHLVIDETRHDDFITNEVWEALRAGVIPVYYGASNIKDHVPSNSIIAADDYYYGSKDATAQRVYEVANSKELWEFHHQWRQGPFPESLQQKYEFLNTSPLCRMCRFSYAKQYGLHWNHARQKVEAKAMNGKLCFCLKRNGSLASPFAETWMTPTLSKGVKGRCSPNNPNNATIQAGDMFVNRTILQHDGVVDIHVNGVSHTEGELILRLDFNVQNADGAYFPNVHQLVVPSQKMLLPLFSMTSVAIQDEFVRVTVVCDWPTRIWSPGNGILQIALESPRGSAPMVKDEVRTIRVIPEDVDQLRDVKTEYTLSPYAKRVIEDFSKPLELFLLVEE